MYKLINKILPITFVIFFLNSAAQAIDSEFKNSLMKIELNKSGTSAYSVDLYTKNKFLEPVKVIKKSDLNYYILLPETKNESTRISGSGADIRSVSTNVYPYAGQDVKNGYVKISIDTVKPIDFKVNVKNISQESRAAQTPAVVAKNDIKDTPLKTDTKVEKKNSSSTSKNTAQIKQQALPKKAPEVKKEQKQPIQNKAKNVAKKVQKPKPPVAPVLKEAIKPQAEPVKKQPIEEKIQEEKIAEPLEVAGENISSQESVENNALQDEGLNQETIVEEDLSEIEQIANDKKPNANFSLLALKNKVSNKLSQYGISLREFAFMVFAFIFSFFFMLTLLTRKSSPQARLKSRKDLVEKDCRTKPKEPLKKEVKNDGQYFVFDKNIQQTGFCDPATSAIKRNYELSSYDPDLKNRYYRNVSQNKKYETEYDIIRKILKEDSFIDLPGPITAQKVEVAPKVQQPKKELQPNATIPIKKEETKAPISNAQKAEQKQNTTDPTVLTSVEIAPERGFMCVSYHDNISLMGYIFDDVFALYNFRAPKLENYDIKFRLTEKDDKLARFIVKVANTKMLIKVTKSAMSMEVLL